MDHFSTGLIFGLFSGASLPDYNHSGEQLAAGRRTEMGRSSSLSWFPSPFRQYLVGGIESVRVAESRC